MGQTTHIAWCDSTVNFWEGCTKVSAGCANCYAEARDRRKMIEPVIHWGPGAPRRKSKSAVKQAHALNRKPWVCDWCGECSDGSTVYCPACGYKPHQKSRSAFRRRRIFSLSLGDWLDPEVPVEWLAEMLDTIRQCSDVDWLLLTKRPELWKDRATSVMRFIEDKGREYADTWHWLLDWACGHTAGIVPRHVLIGASVENQDNDHRIADLLRIPAAVRFLSLEPLLGPLNLRHKLGFKNADGAEIDWVIVAGESGPNARPCNIEWIRSIVDQCKAAGVPCFVKQLGNNAVLTDGDPDAIRAAFPNVKFTSEVAWLHLKHPKGGDINEFPDYLRVREFPKVAR